MQFSPCCLFGDRAGEPVQRDKNSQEEGTQSLGQSRPDCQPWQPAGTARLPQHTVYTLTVPATSAQCHHSHGFLTWTHYNVDETSDTGSRAVTTGAAEETGGEGYQRRPLLRRMACRYWSSLSRWVAGIQPHLSTSWRAAAPTACRLSALASKSAVMAAACT